MFSGKLIDRIHSLCHHFLIGRFWIGNQIPVFTEIHPAGFFTSQAGVFPKLQGYPAIPGKELIVVPVSKPREVASIYQCRKGKRRLLAEVPIFRFRELPVLSHQIDQEKQEDNNKEGTSQQYIMGAPLLGGLTPVFLPTRLLLRFFHSTDLLRTGNTGMRCRWR